MNGGQYLVAAIALILMALAVALNTRESDRG